jgi:hypothetical protein
VLAASRAFASPRWAEINSDKCCLASCLNFTGSVHFLIWG